MLCLRPFCSCPLCRVDNQIFFYSFLWFMDKQKNSQVNVPTGDQPFLHIHEGFLISLYVFLTVTSFVVCLSECSIYSIVLKFARTQFICAKIRIYFDNQHILLFVLYHFKQKCRDLQHVNLVVGILVQDKIDVVRIKIPTTDISFEM